MIVDTEHKAFGVGHRKTPSHTTQNVRVSTESRRKAVETNYIRDNSFVPPLALLISETNWNLSPIDVFLRLPTKRIVHLSCDPVVARWAALLPTTSNQEFDL
jgi:hypothetical protein